MKTGQAKISGILDKFHIRPSKVKELSKGMQMKLMLACAFRMTQTTDIREPTRGLTGFKGMSFHILSDTLKTGEHSVLFSTHITGDLERVADYITYLSYGIVFSGGKDEISDSFRIVKARKELSSDCVKKPWYQAFQPV